MMNVHHTQGGVQVHRRAHVATRCKNTPGENLMRAAALLPCERLALPSAPAWPAALAARTA
jgi:hypothetical protein